MLPPIMYSSLSFCGKHGSSLTARARLVSGPRATRETCRQNAHSVHTWQQTRPADRSLTWFWFSVTSRIIALTAFSFWIFSSHHGSLSLITSPNPSVPKWSEHRLLAPTRGPAQPRKTGICRKNIIYCTMCWHPSRNRWKQQLYNQLHHSFTTILVICNIFFWVKIKLE